MNQKIENPAQQKRLEGIRQSWYGDQHADLFFENTAKTLL